MSPLHQKMYTCGTRIYKILETSVSNICEIENPILYKQILKMQTYEKDMWT